MELSEPKKAARRVRRNLRRRYSGYCVLAAARGKKPPSYPVWLDRKRLEETFSSKTFGFSTRQFFAANRGLLSLGRKMTEEEEREYQTELGASISRSTRKDGYTVKVYRSMSYSRQFPEQRTNLFEANKINPVSPKAQKSRRR